MKKVPLRKCIVTNEMKPKKELIRVVRSKEGIVTVDTTGKKPGRGAYVTKDKQCIMLAKQKQVLENHLKVAIDDTVYYDLLEIIERG